MQNVSPLRPLVGSSKFTWDGSDFSHSHFSHSLTLTALPYAVVGAKGLGRASLPSPFQGREEGWVEEGGGREEWKGGGGGGGVVAWHGGSGVM